MVSLTFTFLWNCYSHLSLELFLSFLDKVFQQKRPVLPSHEFLLNHQRLYEFKYSRFHCITCVSQDAFVCDWLISLTVISLKSTHVVGCVQIPFHFTLNNIMLHLCHIFSALIYSWTLDDFFFFLRISLQ